MPDKNVTDERRFEDRLKDVERRLHTMEDQYANLPGVQQTGEPALEQDTHRKADTQRDQKK